MEAGVTRSNPLREEWGRQRLPPCAQQLAPVLWFAAPAPLLGFGNRDAGRFVFIVALFE